MPDLFDNFFGKINTKINGGKTTPHYGNASRVNTGKFYQHHTNGTNNNYWLPRKNSNASEVVSPSVAPAGQDQTLNLKPRMDSFSSMSSGSEEGGRSRFNSIVSESDK